jgi:hypothetical protein
VGCPRSKPGEYWRLLRSLYGLKRAPKLWFEKLSTHLRSMGLKQSTLSPCIFVGTLIEGHPPIYVGIYVDDIIYFSQDDQVEREEFSWKHHDDGNLSVSLTQQSFAENLIDSVNYSTASVSSYVTPYCSGLLVDPVPSIELSSSEQDKL